MKALAAALATALAVTAGPAAATGDPKRALVETAREVIVPDVNAFSDQAGAFVERVTAFCDEPGDTRLADARSAWHALMDQWGRVSVYRFGPLLGGFPTTLGWRIDGFLMDRRPGAIQEAIEIALLEERPIDAAYIEGVSPLAKGVHAFEYLLFPVDGEAVLPRFREQPRRCTYLTGLATELDANVEELRAGWIGDDGFLTDFINAGGSGSSFFRVQDGVDTLVNAAIATVEHAAKDRVGGPLGADADAARPWQVSSAVARRSLADLDAELDGVAGLLTARRQGEDHYGLDDVLTAGPDAALSQRLTTRLDAVRDAIGAIDGPLGAAVTEHPDAVRQLLAELNRLAALLRIDIAAALDVTLNFNATDGD